MASMGKRTPVLIVLNCLPEFEPERGWPVSNFKTHFSPEFVASGVFA
jgi:hypothetical protein